MTDDASPEPNPPAEDPSGSPPAESARKMNAGDAPGSADEGTDKAEAELKPGLLPLGPPVFGKWAFWITAVPFLVYWGGTVFGSYLETTRKLEPVHTMRGVCRAMVEPVEAAIRSELPAEKADEVLARINLAGVSSALDDEAGSAEEITIPCQQLLDPSLDLRDLPANLQPLLSQFRKRVEHFLVLQAKVEDNDLNEVRIRHIEFRLREEPVATMREMCGFLLEQLDAALEQVPAGEAAEMRGRLDLPRLSAAIVDDTGTVEEVVVASQKLLTDDLGDLPPSVEPTTQQLQSYARHYVSLLTLLATNDGQAISDEHAEFLAAEAENLDAINHELNKSWYPFNYSVACIASIIAVIVALPGYLKIPFRVNVIAYLVGAAGIVVWLGLWWLDDQVLHLGSMFGQHSRAAFNPLDELKYDPVWMYTFLAIRFAGLVLVIPIAEEFFTRGFLMRYIEDIDWDQIPMGMATWKSVVGILVYGAIAHPGELVAAVAWFGLMTWMYLRTKNVWDCVIAHGLTNLLLGLYVIWTDTWELW